MKAEVTHTLRGAGYLEEGGGGLSSGDANRYQCPVCHGTGKMRRPVFRGMKWKMEKRPCTACGDRGWVPMTVREPEAKKERRKRDS